MATILKAKKKRESDEDAENRRLEFEKFMIEKWYWLRNGSILQENPESCWKPIDSLKYEFESWKKSFELRNKSKR